MASPSPAVSPVRDLTDQLFETFCHGHEYDRNQADRRLKRNDPGVDLPRLRARITSYLLEAANARPPLRHYDRSWLIYVLGRVAQGETAALSVVEAHLNAAPPAGADAAEHHGLRYWALAGLARGNDPQAPAIARKVLATTQADPAEAQVRMVATAILAAEGGADERKELLTAIRSKAPLSQWAVLRALRAVRLDDAALTAEVAALVELGENSDITYDSIRALQHVDPRSPSASEARQALEHFLDRWRMFPGRDAMRAKALIGLGKLGSTRSEPLLIEELTDANPAIVREAAISLENILGPRKAAAAVVEVAKERPGRSRDYARALAWMQDQESVTAELSEMMAADDRQIEEVCRELLRQMGGSQAFDKLRAKGNLVASHQKFVAESEDRMNNLFEKTIDEARRGFAWVTTMDQIVFAFGLLLIGVSCTMSLSRTGEFEKYVTGGSGVMSVLYSLFLSKPRDKVEDAVRNLMRLKIVFLGYLHQLRQADQAYQRHLLEDRPVEVAAVNQYRTMIGDAMAKATEEIRQKTS